MTDEELRAAALAYLNHPMGPGGAGRPPRNSRDAGDFARRLLELLPPADDAEPVTAEWLKAVGFVPLTYEPAGTVGPLRWPTRPDERGLSWHPASDRPEVWVYSDTDSDGIGSAYLPDQPTRGHVRRLCACLGITITETQS